MKRIWAVLLLVGIGCGGASKNPQSPSPNTQTAQTPEPTPWPTPWPETNDVPIYSFIHIWYTAVPERCDTPTGAAGGWGPWVWTDKTDDPCATYVSAPWLRQISSTAYPLTGPYESFNEEVMRWQIRQAKAAGIDGFFAAVYSWAPHLSFTFDAFFGDPASGRKGLLQIAQEENFKVAVEGWGPSEPDPVGQRGPWMTEVQRHLDAIEASPYKDAYITIDGMPAYWLIRPTWMTENEWVNFFDGSPERPRRMQWLLRGNIKLDEVVTLNSRLRYSRAQFYSPMVRPSRNGWDHIPGFADDQWRILTYHSATGMIPISHAYMGYDERSGVFEGSYRGRFGLREGDTFIRYFLDETRQIGSRIVLIESWNEWGEGSMIEAGVNIHPFRDMEQERDLYLDDQGRDDPFRYLKIFSEFNGMQEWVPPRPPPCSIIDPLMLQYSPLDLEKSGLCAPVSGQAR